MFGIYIDNGKGKQGYFRNFISGGNSGFKYKLLLSDKDGAMEFMTRSVAENKAYKILETLGETAEATEFYNCKIQLVNFASKSSVPWHSGSTYSLYVKSQESEGYYVQKKVKRVEGVMIPAIVIADTPKKLYASPEAAYGVLRDLQKFLSLEGEYSASSYDFTIVPLG